MKSVIIMLIRYIEPIDKVGVNLLIQDDSLNLIDELIELPLRECCKIFKEKGIETVMSSANKNNILADEMKPMQKKDIKEKELFYPSPTFEEAGKGYAWIMLNFDTLSVDNKDLVFSLEDEIGEEHIWYVQPFTLGNLDYEIKIGKYTYEELENYLSASEIPQGVEYDKYLAQFDRRHIVLGYSNLYPINTLILRMPVNDRTTVEEVEKYFVNLAMRFNNQLEKEEKKAKKQRILLKFTRH